MWKLLFLDLLNWYYTEFCSDVYDFDPNWQVLEVMEDAGEVDTQRWKIAKEEEQEEFWGFEDLEYECDSSFSSPHDTGSTGIC